jgi:Transposase IS116/IS110/IS902 family
VSKLLEILRPAAESEDFHDFFVSTALAFVAAIDDPSRIRRSRDIGAYFGLFPRSA